MKENTFDMIVIGAGPGGYVAAIRGAQLGLNVAIIEREHMGGICLNWGCIPTKAMLRSAEIFHLLKNSKDFGIEAKNIKYDLEAIVSRSKGIGSKLSKGITHLLKKNKITSILGEARLTAVGQVKVKTNDKEVELFSRNIVLATGARARDLKGFEADGKNIWTYKDALRPKIIPKKLLVIGSGAIGVEFASFYNTLGVETTILEVMDTILPVEDREISNFAKKQFEKQGINILENSKALAFNRKNNSFSVKIDTLGKVSSLDCDTIISAVGIVGNIEGLGLEGLRVEIEDSHVLVDDFCRTNIEGLFAIGDLAGAPWLAHKASHEGIMVAELIAGGSPHPIDYKGIAGCTYCFPQVASVGVTEEQAKENGLETKIGRFPFTANGKALALGEQEGIIKTIFDVKSGELLGAHMVGPEVTELIQGYVIGRKLETTEEDLINTIFPHPTLGESMHESVLNAFDRAIHI